ALIERHEPEFLAIAICEEMKRTGDVNARADDGGCERRSIGFADERDPPPRRVMRVGHVSSVCRQHQSAGRSAVGSSMSRRVNRPSSTPSRYSSLGSAIVANPWNAVSKP